MLITDMAAMCSMHSVVKSESIGNSKLESLTISTHFQRPTGGIGKCVFRVLAGGDIKLMAFQTTKEVTADTRTL
jgi:hypothetical protein